MAIRYHSVTAIFKFGSQRAESRSA